jgi:hypothetical protein
MSNIEYSKIKPPSQTCSICLDDVDADDEINGGIPNCVTCKNGHYLHRQCFDKMQNRTCPQCREPVVYNCLGYQGYLVPLRKGGKNKKNTTKIRKTLRKRKNLRKRKTLRK